MARSALLAVVAALLLAGCVGPIGGGTPTATPYPDELVPFPDGPKERPPLPGELTDETARDYAVAHEFRFSYNELWSPGAEVGMSEHSCSVEALEAAGEGYLVTVGCTGYVNEPVDGETETRHVDLAPWTVRYYLDGDSVLRTELE